MKKVLSILLALAMLFAFCAMIGCGDKDDTKGNDDDKQNLDNVEGDSLKKDEDELEEIDEETLKNSLPNEYIPEKLAAGMDVYVGISAMNLADETIQKYYYGAQEALIKDGYEALVTDAGGDNVTQFSQIENFLEMDCALICFGVYEVDAYADFAARCTDAGVYTVILDCSPTYFVNVNMYVDGREIGVQATNMALKWVDYYYGEDAPEKSIHACIMQHTSGEERRKRTDAMMELLPQDPRIDVTYTNDMVLTVDGGYTAAEEALTYDPDIRLFMCFNADPGVGVNNYVLSLQGVKVEEFAVFCTGLTDSNRALIDASWEDPNSSCYRGTIGQGSQCPYDEELAPIYYSYYTVISNCLNGEYDEGGTFYERAYAYCHFGYTYDNWAE